MHIFLFLGSMGTINTHGDLPKVFDESTKITQEKIMQWQFALSHWATFYSYSITAHHMRKLRSSGSIQCNCSAPGFIYSNT